MAQQENTEDDAPLDPAMERVRRKMIRLLVISIGIMMAGLMAVFAAIVYKANEDANAGRADSDVGSASGRIADDLSAIKLPTNVEILSSSLDGGRIMFHVQLDSGEEALLFYSLADGRRLGRLVLK